MYIPKPMKTEHILLPQELSELTERLAENVHEQWALGRLAEGWQYGPKRDDEKKTTPCLVPYALLPDSEREFDRVTAMQTLKVILALGYKIVKE